MKTNDLIEWMLGFFTNQPRPRYYIIEAAPLDEFLTNPLTAHFTNFDTGHHSEQEAIEIRNILNSVEKNQKLYFRMTAIY